MQQMDITLISGVFHQLSHQSSKIIDTIHLITSTLFRGDGHGMVLAPIFPIDTARPLPGVRRCWGSARQPGAIQRRLALGVLGWYVTLLTVVATTFTPWTSSLCAK
jgi:hypothetical protein